MDVDAGTLTLNCDEPVNVAMFDTTGITVQAEPSVAAALRYTLTGGSSSSDNGLQVVVGVSGVDLNEIKKKDGVLVSVATSYIVVTAGVVEDMGGNSVSAVTSGDALQAASFDGDETRPVLSSFDVDMDAGTMTLHFPETMDVSTTNFSAVTLQRASSSSGSASHRLTGGLLGEADDDTSVVVEMTADDMNILKVLEVAADVGSTWLVLDAGAVSDMNGLGCSALVDGVNARQVDEYAADATSPTLESFDVSIDAGTLTLEFSETVRRTTLVVTTMSLQSASNRSDATARFDLSAGSGSVSANGPTIVVEIGDEDLNEIKRLSALATGTEDTYLVMSGGSIEDMAGNGVEAIGETAAVQVVEFVADGTRPEIVSYDLDLSGDGEWRLTFSETVNVSSVDVTEFTLQSRANSEDGGSQVRLSGGYY